MQTPNHSTHTTRGAVIGIACITVLSALFMGGCSSSKNKAKFNPATYTTFTDNPKIAASKKVIVCQPADAIPPKDRVTFNYAPTFKPADYLRRMLTTELQDRNVTVSDIGSGALSGFDAVTSWLARSNDVPSDTVVLASSIVWFEYFSRFACDVKVYDNRGNLLFAKRGMSTLYDSTLKNFTWAHSYAMKSVFDDPEFQQVLR